MVEYSEGRMVNRLTPYTEREFNQILQSSKGNYVITGLEVQGWYTGCGFSHWQVRIDYGSAWLETEKATIPETTYYGPFTVLSDGDANERYDLLYIDTTGLGVIEGVEATKGTAVIPDIPEDKVVLSRIHINNNDAWLSEVLYPDVQDGDCFDWRVFGTTTINSEFFKNVGDKYILYDQLIVLADLTPIGVQGKTSVVLGQFYYKEPDHALIPSTDRYVELVIEMRALYEDCYARVAWSGGSIYISRFQDGTYTLKRNGTTNMPSDGDLLTFQIFGTETLATVACRACWLNFYAKVT